MYTPPLNSMFYALEMRRPATQETLHARQRFHCSPCGENICYKIDILYYYY